MRSPRDSPEEDLVSRKPGVQRSTRWYKWVTGTNPRCYLAWRLDTLDFSSVSSIPRICRPYFETEIGEYGYWANETPSQPTHGVALPSHASPVYSSRPLSGTVSEYDLSYDRSVSPPPNTLLSPAFTPPSTPGTRTPLSRATIKPIPVDTTSHKPQKLLETLPQVDCVVRARIPTVTGAEMFLHLYQNDIDNKEHLAIVFGPHIRSRSLDAPRAGESELDRMIRGAYTGRLHPGRTSSRVDPEPLMSQNDTPTSAPRSLPTEPLPPSAPLVRIHSECYTGETAWSARCDCGEQLDEAARLMSLPSSTGGVIVYLRQEGRGIGLGEKLKAYNLQDLGSDTVEANLLLRHPADARSYGLATAMLLDLGFGGDSGIRLLTNNPDKVRAVEGPNREIVVKQRVAMIPLAWKSGGKRGIHSEEIEGYLRTKIGKMGHMIE